MVSDARHWMEAVLRWNHEASYLSENCLFKAHRRRSVGNPKSDSLLYIEK